MSELQSCLGPAGPQVERETRDQIKIKKDPARAVSFRVRQNATDHTTRTQHQNCVSLFFTVTSTLLLSIIPIHLRRQFTVYCTLVNYFLSREKN
jgi:hypothetical protein